jgi:hypothetical protein
MTPAPKLHHYVPMMLLRRFSEAPAEENPRIACLDKATGSIRWSSVRNEAAVTDHNRLREVPERDPELDPLAAEHIVSVIEDAALWRFAGWTSICRSGRDNCPTWRRSS